MQHIQSQEQGHGFTNTRISVPCCNLETFSRQTQSGSGFKS